MPFGKGVRYRVKTTKTGKRIRLAFRGNKVIEAKNIDTGMKHTIRLKSKRRRKK